MLHTDQPSAQEVNQFTQEVTSAGQEVTSVTQEETPASQDLEETKSKGENEETQCKATDSTQVQLKILINVISFQQHLNQLPSGHGM